MEEIALEPRRIPASYGRPFPRQRQLLPGLALGGLIAVAAMEAGRLPWFGAHGLSALTIAIVLGILVGNTVYAKVAVASTAGVTFSKQALLRAGVVLYGLRLTLSDIGRVGAAGVLIDALVVTSTFTLAVWVGTRLLQIDRVTAMLIGAGSAICGAAAVMATEPVVKGKTEQAAVAVACVVMFGTLSIFLYPGLYHLTLRLHIFQGGAQAFGVYTGSTIHEVAQVFAAGRAVSEQAADTAVITKMVRVMMLAPFLVCLSAWLSMRSSPRRITTIQVPHVRAKITVPWFALGFIAVVALNSTGVVPTSWTADAIALDTFLLAMAMAALGLTTNIRQVRQAGPRPLSLGLILFIWLVVGGALINHFVWALMP